MKDQRGFFTVIGLCFLLAVSVCIKNIQESETIFTFGASDFKDEQELQNAADSALLEAVEKIKFNVELVPKPANYFGNRSDRQHKISVSQPILSKTSRFENIQVEVYGEHGNIHSELGVESDIGTAPADEEGDGIILISVASGQSRIDNKKIYRRSLAFVRIDDAGVVQDKIFFLNSL